MQTSIHYPPPEHTTPATPSATRLRTVTGNRFPRWCACGACREWIPRDSEVR